jgi:predicted flap endonuclease-1-like 5' DNA nuclease
MASIDKVEGIGEAFAKKLKEAGINTVEALLEKGAAPKGRKELAASTGISDTLILKWVNRADLDRVKGIGEEYADLLEAAGVDTVPELAKRVPANLHAKLVEVNTAKKLVRQLPTEAAVAGWVESAKALPRVVTY